MKASAMSRQVAVEVALFVMLVLATGCSSRGTPQDPVGQTRARVIGTNGLGENGLGENGLTMNGLGENGLGENGLGENGLGENGLTLNGLGENGLGENGLGENGLSVMDILDRDPNAVDFLKYVYSCAMPPGASLTLTLHHTDADGGAITTEDGGTSTEQVVLEGKHGLAPEWGAADDAKCNDDCKRWVSACLLARTNAYGQHVKISLRAPRSIWNPAIPAEKDALDRTQYLVMSTPGGPDGGGCPDGGSADGGCPDEAADYPLREGAYFGNVFETAVDGNGLTVHAPKYYACAGPASSIPQLTQRFCSGQGDDCIIFTGDSTTYDTCTEEKPACTGLDSANSAAHDCTGPDGHTYREVLTVYLQQPVPVCGNHVCEGPDPTKTYPPDTIFETDSSCPSDCHPGTWAKGVDLLQPTDGTPCPDCFATSMTGSSRQDIDPDFGRRLAIGFNGNLIRAVDAMSKSAGGIDFKVDDGFPLPAPDPILTPSLLAVYDHDGVPQLGAQLSFASQTATRVRSVATDSAGNMFFATSDPLAIIKTNRSGNVIWQSTNFGVNGVVAGPIITDGTNAYIAYLAAFVIDAGSFTALAKFGPDGPDGVAPIWTATLTVNDPNADVAHGALALDGAGNIFMTDVANIHKVAPDGSIPLRSDGITPWTKPRSNFIGGIISFTGVAADPSGSGDVYVAGITTDVARFDTTPTADGGLPPALNRPGGFVVKFAGADGVFAWNYLLPQGTLISRLLQPTIRPIGLGVDPDGNLIVAGGFVGDGLTPSFGVVPPVDTKGLPGLAPPFSTQGSPDTFIVGLSSTTGSPIWAKQIELYSAGGSDALTISSTGRVFLSGGFNGSMTLDEFQLIHTHASLLVDQNLFVGGFQAPCSAPGCDIIPPYFDLSAVPGSATSVVGHSIIVYATRKDGAQVHYARPTARNADGQNNPDAFTDTHYDGISVVCLPLSGSIFPIGINTVNCTASDPHGNTTQTSFTITVLGNAGPKFTSRPPDITLDATSPAGAVATYQTPIAVSQIDGPETVTCTPPSGSTFPVGTTIVTCTASDSGNTSHVSFHVTVVSHAPPTITVPTPGPVVDAQGPQGAVVTYVASAKDSFGHPIAVTCVPRSGSLFPLGSTTVTCSAIDSFGNSASKSFTVQVRYNWFGLLPPVKNDGSSVFKLGQDIPVKFRLSPGITTAVANLTLAKITNGVPGPEQNAVSSGGANQGNLFRFDPRCQFYIFNLSTMKLSAGLWRLTINLHDGVPHTVNITLKVKLSTAEALASATTTSCN